MKIRGIRVDRLLKSGLYPYLNALITMWAEKHRITLFTDIRDIKNIEAFAYAITITSLILSIWFAGSFALLAVVPANLFVLHIVRMGPVRKFVRAVNRLDYLLSANCLTNGIAHPRLLDTPIQDVARDLVYRRILVIADTEVGPNCENASTVEQLREDRDLMRELARHLRNEFGKDIGPLDPMFARATVEIAKRQQSQAEQSVA